ncbi:MAG: DUF4126 domain-containing protein [Candidatus Acidiferrales bacterium]
MLLSLSTIASFVPRGTELAAVLVVICFSAGLNVYATVAMLGVLARFGVLALPPSLHAIENPWVMALCGLLFALEFVGDKIPVFDLLWNAAHTFIRVPVAALIAYASTSNLPPREQIAATLIGGLIALAAHGGKMAARAAVTASPEPVSNFALSVSEDAAVVFLTWFATQHPFAAAAIVLLLIALIVAMARAVIRALRQLFDEAEDALTENGAPKR